MCDGLAPRSLKTRSGDHIRPLATASVLGVADYFFSQVWRSSFAHVMDRLTLGGKPLT